MTAPRRHSLLRRHPRPACNRETVRNPLHRHNLSHLQLCSPFVVNAGATDLMSPTRLFVPLALSLLAACATQPKQNVTVEKQSECPVKLQQRAKPDPDPAKQPDHGLPLGDPGFGRWRIARAQPRGLQQPGRRGDRRQRRPLDLALPVLRRGHGPFAPDLLTTMGTGSTGSGNLRLRDLG